MDPIITQAVAGLRSRMESLDMLANNLANAATGGFKADREYYGVYNSASPEAAGQPDFDATLPNIERQWTDFSQGLMHPTGNPLDVALEGKGFFSVKTSTGSLYTRSGSFHIDPKGLLVTTEGYPVLSRKGLPIKLLPQSVVDVTVDGTVQQEGQVVGQLELAQFKDPAMLTKQGHTYFRYMGPDNQKQAATPEVRQGRLEGSNVGTAESAVRLVNVMRQFEMLQRAISVVTDMGRKSVEDIAKV